MSQKFFTFLCHNVVILILHQDLLRYLRPYPNLRLEIKLEISITHCAGILLLNTMQSFNHAGSRPI